MSEMYVEYTPDKRETKIVIKIEDSELRRHHLVPIDPNNNVETLAYYVQHCLEMINDNRMREGDAKRRRWLR